MKKLKNCVCLAERLAYRWIFLLFVCLFTCLFVKAERNLTRLYKQCAVLGSDKLMNMGDGFLVENKTDSAYVCYSIITNRYVDDMSPKDKSLCVEACLRQWRIYFFYFFDYKMSLSILDKAKAIAEDIGERNPEIYLSYGIIYLTVGEQSSLRNYKFKAIEYFRKSLYLSQMTNVKKCIDDAFGNIVLLAPQTVGMENISKDWIIYKKLKTNEFDGYRRYNELLYKGYLAMYKREYADALASFRMQLDIKNVSVTRYHTAAYNNMALVFNDMGQYLKAISCLDIPQKIAEEHKVKDVLLDIYKQKAIYFRKAGNMYLYGEYTHKANHLKDELQAYQQISNLNEAKFLDKLNYAKKQVDDERAKNRFLFKVEIATFVVVGSVLLFLLIICHKNKLLRRANIQLYMRNMELLKVERSAARLRTKYGEVQYACNTPNVPYKEKYKISHLGEAQKDSILAKVTETMESCEEVFTPDFSAERLAKITGIPYAYISQVINERCQCNFYHFINKYRINEACRRINKGHDFKRLTIEAISNSVGFKSRTTFISSFKRVTGLLPSEYIRIANSKKHPDV